MFPSLQQAAKTSTDGGDPVSNWRKVQEQLCQSQMDSLY